MIKISNVNVLVKLVKNKEEIIKKTRKLQKQFSFCGKDKTPSYSNKIVR